MSSRFGQAMRLMRSHNPQKREDGFGLLRDHAADHLDELMSELAREDDPGLRCWLLELIGEARSPQAVPLLTANLYQGDEALRSWAVSGLRLLGTPEARTILYQARANGLIS